MIEDLMEIAFEIDMLLQSFERHFSSSLLFSAVMSTLKKDIGPRLCLEMLFRMINNDLLPASLTQNDEEKLLFYLVNAFDSKKAATRKAAYDCAYSLYDKKGAEWVGLFFAQLKTKIGAPRELVVRNMLERQRAAFAQG
jgi:hypothetical protein